MSELTGFRNHCREMATAVHRLECRLWVERPGIFQPFGRWVIPSPECAGCLSESDRALFALLAAEVDDYLDHPAETDLFGESAIEPRSDPT